MRISDWSSDVCSSDLAARIADRVRTRTGIAVDRLLVAPMIRPLQEVLIGYRLDAQVGPVVTLAPGGVLIGLYADQAVGLELGRASGRERVCQYVSISVGAVSLKNKSIRSNNNI